MNNDYFRIAFTAEFLLISIVKVLIISSLLISRSGYAGYGTNPEMQYLADIPVVLSVTRLAQPVTHAPASVTIIDREMIEASGTTRIPDLFRLVPGFFVSYKRTGIPVVSYHGFGDTYARRLQVLVDGRSVYLPSFGGVQWPDLALSIEDIKRIEVIRGPNTASYGANAFLATINIQTFAPDELNGNYVKVLHSTHDDKRFIVRHVENNDDTQYRVTLSYERDPGQNMFTSRFGSVRDYNDGVRGSSLSTRIDHRLSANDSLYIKFGMHNGSKGDKEIANADQIHDQKVLSHYQQLKLTRKLNKDDELSIQLYHNYHSQKELYFDSSLGPPIPVNYDMSAERFDVELQHKLRLAQNAKLVWGLNHRLDKSKSVTYFRSGQPDYRLTRAFANIEWYINDTLSYNLGGMIEDNNFTGTDTSPRIALNYTITPKHSVRAILSKAIRVPSALEERADAYICIDFPALVCATKFPFLAGSQNLIPEEIISREIGYHYLIGIKSYIDFKLYKDAISHLISVDSSVNPRALVNSDDVKVEGAEIQANLLLGKNTRMYLTYAYTEMKGSNIKEEYDQSSPKNTHSVLVIHKFPKRVTGSIAIYRMDEHKPLDGNEIHNIERFDVKLSKAFKLNNIKGRVSLVGQSINGNYVEYNTDIHFESRGYISLELFDF